MVECDLAKVDVAGSNPVSRSIVVFTRWVARAPVAGPKEAPSVSRPAVVGR